MLILEFYTIEDFQLAENKVIAKLRLNPKHEIYTGHFPDQPIVPGVVQLQIVKELVEKATNQKMMMTEMSFAKFLRMIIPQTSALITFVIDFNQKNNAISFAAQITGEEVTYSKVKGTFSIVNQ